MRCIENIKDIALDCRYRPTKGLKHRLLVIPYKDIDRKLTKWNADKSSITDLQLKIDKKGYLFELSNAFKVNGSQKLSGGFVHELSIKIDKADSDNIATMNALTKGTYILVVETMNNTFEILGYEAGVVVNSVQRDYARNVIGLTFTTPSDVKELRMVAFWNEGDYNDRVAKFENGAFSVGRNLLRDSGVVVTNNKYEIAKYQLTEDINIGDVLTLSADADLQDKKWDFLLLMNAAGGGNGSFGSLRVGTTTWDNERKIGMKKGDFFTVYVVGNGNSTKTNTIRKIKLERGNKATRWVPSSEDN